MTGVALRASAPGARAVALAGALALASCGQDRSGRAEVVLDSVIVADAYASNPTVALTDSGHALVTFVAGHSLVIGH